MNKLINKLKKYMNEAMSPTPKKVEEKVDLNKMDFPDALREVTAGKKITKLEWCNKAVFGELKDELLVLWKDDGKMYNWIISEADLQGEDFVVIN